MERVPDVKVADSVNVKLRPRSTRWLAGYLLALAHRDETLLSKEDLSVLDEASRRLRNLAPEPVEENEHG